MQLGMKYVGVDKQPFEPEEQNGKKKVYFTELQSKILDLVNYCGRDAKVVECSIEFIRIFSNLQISLYGAEKVEIASHYYEKNQPTLPPEVVPAKTQVEVSAQEPTAKTVDRKEVKNFITELLPEQLRAITPKEVCKHFNSLDDHVLRNYTKRILYDQRKKQFGGGSQDGRTN